MSDPIDRQAAIDALEEWESKYTWDSWAYDHKDDLTCHIESPSSVIKKLSSVEPERKKGKCEIDGHRIRCNQCGVYMCDTDREGDSIPTNFCPECGADMSATVENKSTDIYKPGTVVYHNEYGAGMITSRTQNGIPNYPIYIRLEFINGDVIECPINDEKLKDFTFNANPSEYVQESIWHGIWSKAEEDK